MVARHIFVAEKLCSYWFGFVCVPAPLTVLSVEWPYLEQTYLDECLFLLFLGRFVCSVGFSDQRDQRQQNTKRSWRRTPTTTVKRRRVSIKKDWHSFILARTAKVRAFPFFLFHWRTFYHSSYTQRRLISCLSLYHRLEVSSTSSKKKCQDSSLLVCW